MLELVSIYPAQSALIAIVVTTVAVKVLPLNAWVALGVVVSIAFNLT